MSRSERVRSCVRHVVSLCTKPHTARVAGIVLLAALTSLAAALASSSVAATGREALRPVPFTIPSAVSRPGAHGPSLAPAADATVTGDVKLCGGIALGPPCRISTIGICPTSSGPCFTSDSIVIIGDDGRQTARQKLRRARFRLTVIPGDYTVELLGGGKRVHDRVIRRQKIRARAHHTVVVAFVFEVK
jgi:hypothetical protein